MHLPLPAGTSALAGSRDGARLYVANPASGVTVLEPDSAAAPTVWPALGAVDQALDLRDLRLGVLVRGIEACRHRVAVAELRDLVVPGDLQQAGGKQCEPRAHGFSGSDGNVSTAYWA